MRQHEHLQVKDEVDRLYVQSKEEKRLISIEDLRRLCYEGTGRLHKAV